jgi:hypothetical protein
VEVLQGSATYLAILDGSLKPGKNETQPDEE